MLFIHSQFPRPGRAVHPAVIEASLLCPGLLHALPYLTILPMGWSWALHFCQMVLNNAIQQAGFVGRQVFGDKRSGVQLNGDDDIAVAGYVDNFGVFGTCPTAVNSESLRAMGLTVREEEGLANMDTLLDCILMVRPALFLFLRKDFAT